MRSCARHRREAKSSRRQHNGDEGLAYASTATYLPSGCCVALSRARTPSLLSWEKSSRRMAKLSSAVYVIAKFDFSPGIVGEPVKPPLTICVASVGRSASLHYRPTAPRLTLLQPPNPLPIPLSLLIRRLFLQRSKQIERREAKEGNGHALRICRDVGTGQHAEVSEEEGCMLLCFEDQPLLPWRRRRGW